MCPLPGRDKGGGEWNCSDSQKVQTKIFQVCFVFSFKIYFLRFMIFFIAQTFFYDVKLFGGPNPCHIIV